MKLPKPRRSRREWLSSPNELLRKAELATDIFEGHVAGGPVVSRPNWIRDGRHLEARANTAWRNWADAVFSSPTAAENLKKVLREGVRFEPFVIE